MDLQKQAERCQARGLYRAASPRDVLWNLVWNGGRYEDLTRVCRVDCFISHVSSSASWGKALALCQYLNFDLAFASSILTWITTILVMLLRAGSYTALLNQDFYFLNLILIASPTAVFIVAYFGGHVMSRKALWFDQVCVSESPLARLETIQAIPCFIATAKVMVLLWDEPRTGEAVVLFSHLDRVMSCRVASRRVASCRIVSCHVVSCRVVSCQVASSLLVLCQVLSRAL